jgi:hypothetical protein
MTKSAYHIVNSRTAMERTLQAAMKLAEAMADAEAPHGGMAYAVHAGAARQLLLEAVAALDDRLRTGTTLPTLPALPARLEAR